VTECGLAGKPLITEPDEVAESDATVLRLGLNTPVVLGGCLARPLGRAEKRVRELTLARVVREPHLLQLAAHFDYRQRRPAHPHQQEGNTERSFDDQRGQAYEEAALKPLVHSGKRLGRAQGQTIIRGCAHLSAPLIVATEKLLSPRRSLDSRCVD